MELRHERLLASLSIGSLALAFAAKDALANVFGSFVIIVDKPFKVGDWISANGVEGTVEKNYFPQHLHTHLSAGTCVCSKLAAFQHANY